MSAIDTIGPRALDNKVAAGQRIVAEMTTTSLDALVVFQAVAQTRSFTRAGQAVGVDKSRVSRIIRSLEERLGVALVVRSTRVVTLTAEGEALFRRCGPHLLGLQEALSSVPRPLERPAGEVSITTTPDLGRAVLAPVLAGFRKQFPLVTVRVVLGSDLVELMSSGVDLALRVGRAGMGSLKARRVGALKAGFYAAPGYLSVRGTPRSFAELARHDGLWPAPRRGQRSFATAAHRAGAVTCDDFSMLSELAVLGAGIAVLPSFVAERRVSEGALVRVLPEVVLENAPLFLVSRPVSPVPARVKALAEFLVAALRSRAD